MTVSQAADGGLELAAAFWSDAGPRLDNQDFAGFINSEPRRRAGYGGVAALADGVGGSKGGRVAAELTVRTFLDGYFGQSELLGVQRTSARALQSVNGWVHTVGRRDPDLDGMACTFTGLILRGRQSHVVHVGDSRLYRLRDDRLDLLTTDHTYPQPGMKGVLKRAVGADEFIQIEYRAEPTRVYDRYLLCSDGLHGVLSDGAIQSELAQRRSPDETARALVQKALQARTTDNVTVLVVDILRLPAASQPDLELAIGARPLGTVPSSGAVLDGFRLERVLSDGRYTRVFLAHDEHTSHDVILKFPKPVAGADAVLRAAFLRESWIAARVRSTAVAEVIEINPERQSQLYIVTPLYVGETLDERLRRDPPVSLEEGLDIGIRLARGVGALHRAGIIHRDVKPENVILERIADRFTGLKLIDLGVARLPQMEDFTLDHAPGTPSYMAPEMLAGDAGNEATDQFALGVTLFRMFARTFPYGEVEPFSKPRFGVPGSLTASRPDLPAWLERVLARAIAVDPADRYGDVLELLYDLDHGSTRAAPVRTRRRSLYERNPVLVWQVVAAGLALALFLSQAFRHGPG